VGQYKTRESSADGRTVEEAHTGLIERLAVLKPYCILYIADVKDLEERVEHLEQVLGAVLDYVGAIVVDTSHVAPGGSIDCKYLLGWVSDLAGDVAGSIANAADDLAAGRSDERHPIPARFDCGAVCRVRLAWWPLRPPSQSCTYHGKVRSAASMRFWRRATMPTCSGPRGRRRRSIWGCLPICSSR
jgi:hypothetical protein